MNGYRDREESEAAFAFKVGGTYSNRQGKYRVLEVRAADLRVRFDNGTKGTLDLWIQSRILANMAREAVRGVRNLRPL